jgi:lycopene beta-cyclase
MSTPSYDFILAGGGAAGLSLAYRLANSPLRDRSILIVDRLVGSRPDHVWSFWAERPTPYDSIVYRTWNRLQVAGENGVNIVDLAPYCYQTIRGRDFQRFVHQHLSALCNVTFLRGKVERIEDSPEHTRVVVDGQPYAGRWVFDSRFRWSDFNPAPAHAHTLQQRFLGWEIVTDAPVFDPQVATFLDFRTPQEHEARFFYLLPFDEQRALVQYVACTTAAPSHAAQEQAITDYLENVLGIKHYTVQEREGGASLMTDQPFPRRAGEHVMRLGMAGGRLKPSSGFAFQRIQQDSVAIVQSLLATGSPFNIPPDSRRYRLYDSIMLQIMQEQGERIKPIFTALFKQNPPQRIFRFLDESASPLAELLVAASLPTRYLIGPLLARLRPRR